MKRFFDLILSSILIVLLSPVWGLVSLTLLLFDRGPILHWSKRVGRKNKIFLMPKFRTMKVGTPQLATHKMVKSQDYLTSLGRFLRKTSLDELPQLMSILRGQMSFVGPRPALFNQDDLVGLRSQQGVDEMVPGLTGWAQINGRDEISIQRKVELDSYYCQHQSFLFDLKILFSTFFKVFKDRNISH